MKEGFATGQTRNEANHLADLRKGLAEEMATTLQWLLDHAASIGIREGRIVVDDAGLHEEYASSLNRIIVLNEQVERAAAEIRAGLGSKLETLDKQMQGLDRP